MAHVSETTRRKISRHWHEYDADITVSYTAIVTVRREIPDVLGLLTYYLHTSSQYGAAEIV